jgi:uncharacterized DUF497 family protein
MQYYFEWDPRKAESNQQKHNVTFELAATIFRDPSAISIYDTDHSEDEDRWLTLGISATGALLVVHHTFQQVNDEAAIIRIISSRKATKRENRQYME